MEPQNLPPTRNTLAYEHPALAYDLGTLDPGEDPLDLSHLGLVPVDRAITSAVQDAVQHEWTRCTFFVFEDLTTKAKFLRLHLQGSNPQLIPYPLERVPYEVGDTVCCPVPPGLGYVPKVGDQRITVGTITETTPMHPRDKDFACQEVWVQWERWDDETNVRVRDEPKRDVASNVRLYRQEPRVY